MPPLYYPRPRTGKQPPMVLPRGLELVVDLGDGGWPKCLVIPNDAGLLDPTCLVWHGEEAANDTANVRTGSAAPDPEGDVIDRA